MNVWMKKNNKQAKCGWCPKPVEKGFYMVVTCYYLWNSTIQKNWLKKVYYHPQCWIDQAVFALEKKPAVENRGKPRMSITDENRKERTKILARRASVLQRLRKASDNGSVEEMIHLGSMLSTLKEEIEKVGGAPEKW